MVHSRSSSSYRPARGATRLCAPQPDAPGWRAPRSVRGPVRFSRPAVRGCCGSSGSAAKRLPSEPLRTPGRGLPSPSRPASLRRPSRAANGSRQGPRKARQTRRAGANVTTAPAAIPPSTNAMKSRSRSGSGNSTVRPIPHRLPDSAAPAASSLSRRAGCPSDRPTPRHCSVARRPDSPRIDPNHSPRLVSGIVVANTPVTMRLFSST